MPDPSLLPLPRLCVLHGRDVGDGGGGGDGARGDPLHGHNLHLAAIENCRTVRSARVIQNAG